MQINGSVGIGGGCCGGSLTLRTVQGRGYGTGDLLVPPSDNSIGVTGTSSDSSTGNPMLIESAQLRASSFRRRSQRAGTRMTRILRINFVFRKNAAASRSAARRAWNDSGRVCSSSTGSTIGPGNARPGSDVSSSELDFSFPAQPLFLLDFQHFSPLFLSGRARSPDSGSRRGIAVSTCLSSQQESLLRTNSGSSLQAAISALNGTVSKQFQKC